MNGSFTNVAIRGASGNQNDVVLVGRGMTVDGGVPFGIRTGGNVTGVTIANLTIRDTLQMTGTVRYGPSARRTSGRTNMAVARLPTHPVTCASRQHRSKGCWQLVGPQSDVYPSPSALAVFFDLPQFRHHRVTIVEERRKRIALLCEGLFHTLHLICAVASDQVEEDLSVAR